MKFFSTYLNTTENNTLNIYGDNCSFFSNWAFVKNFKDSIQARQTSIISFGTLHLDLKVAIATLKV